MILPCCPFHESGHALVAESVGIEVLAVTVHEDGSGGSLDRGLFRDPDTARADGFMVMMMAGMAAEEAYWGDPDTAWEHAAGDRAGLRKFGHSDSEMIGYARAAREIIEAQRPAWTRLAHAMGGGGTFPGDMVRSVLAGGPVDARLALAAIEARGTE